MARKRYKPEEIVAKSSGLCDNQSGMLPPPASMSLGIPYLQTKNAPVRLTAGVSFHFASSSSSVVPNGSLFAAVLTRTSMRENASAAASIAAFTSAAFGTSQRCAIGRPPALAIEPTVRAAASALISTHMTAAPSVAKRRAIAPAIAPPAPVMKATLPSSRATSTATTCAA